MALHRFSVESLRDFWRTFLDWSGVVYEGDSDPVCVGDDVWSARFFPGVRLSYAENLLRPLPGVLEDAPALTSVHGDGSVEQLSRAELRTAVQRTSLALAALGLGIADPVVGIAPNHSGMVVASLAVAAVGATLSTATPDMGPGSLLGRFGQVRPRFLLVDRTGMARDSDPADVVLMTLLAGLPTVEHVLVLDGQALPEVPGRQVARLADLVARRPEDVRDAHWPRLPFDHPLWTMFSSGTTGPPKAIVHGAGGSLLEHVKEHRLHGDLSSVDTLYFHTTTAWMMWNWQLSALAVGAHVVLYDGPVAGPATLWELVAAHGVTVFGTSPAYLQLCQDEGYRPAEAVDLRALRAVLSTGAVLHEWQFGWVADAVGPVPLQSISGGTDILGCFVLGHPEEPVQPGRCQSLSLGMDVVALDEDGQPVLGRVGELVCRRPFPSRPVGFLADPGGARFAEAYFSQHPGVWTHGDLIEVARDGSARMLGRSDGVLNIDGVRIGPAEIYTILRRLPEVADAMAVEQQQPADAGASRLVLLVVLRDGAQLDDLLAQRIRAILRREGSPAHVPSLVLAVDELPTTHNGKRSELAARDAVNGLAPRNTASLRNPGSLVAIAAAAAAPPPATDVPAAGAGETDVAATVTRAFREVLGRSIGERTNFFDAGGTSRQSMTLLRRLREDVGRAIGMNAFLADPTIAGVTTALADEGADEGPVQVLRPGDGTSPPLYVVQGMHADTYSFFYVVDALTLDCPVLGLTGPLTGPDGRQLPIADIAAAHVADLVEHQPTGPIRLMGYSFGGLVAFEMARRLATLGREVTFLGLLDVIPPRASLTTAERRARRAAYLLLALVTSPRSAKGRRAVVNAVRPRRRPTDGAQPQGSPQAAYQAHSWGRYGGPVIYFRVSRRIPVLTHLLVAWRRVAPAMTVINCPGGHHEMLRRDNAPFLAAKLSAALRASDDEVARGATWSTAGRRPGRQ
jgi:acetoacetyl-CoA synthetase